MLLRLSHSVSKSGRKFLGCNNKILEQGNTLSIIQAQAYSTGHPSLHPTNPVNKGPRYPAVVQLKRARKATTNPPGGEKPLPNIFSDETLESPFGPSLLRNLRNSKTYHSNKERTEEQQNKALKDSLATLLGSYHMDEKILNQISLISAGLLQLQKSPNGFFDDPINKSMIPLLYLHHPSVSANYLLREITLYLCHQLETELLELSSARIFQIGKALHRYFKKTNTFYNPAAEIIGEGVEDLKLVNKLQMRTEGSRFLHLHGTFSLARSQIKDFFLPGLTFILKSLVKFSPTTPKIILIKDLPNFFDSIENKRSLQDWLTEFLIPSSEAEIIPPIMLVGFDFNKYDFGSAALQNQIYPEEAPPSDCETIEMDVYRYRQMLARIQASAAGASLGQSPTSPNRLPEEHPANLNAEKSSSPLGSINAKVWNPARPTTTFIDEGGALIYAVTAPNNPAQARLFEKKIRKDEADIIQRWNWLQLTKDLSQLKKLEPSSDTVAYLSTKLLHEDEIASILLLSNGSLYEKGEKAKITLHDLESAIKAYFSNQPKPGAVSNAFMLDQSSLSKHEKRFLPSLVHPEQVVVKFSDIGALDKPKNILKEVITMPIQRPDLFSVGILKESVSGVLLFGPPGTGKSLLAKAVAAECGAAFLSIHLSSIFDMWVGEGEKNVRGLFSLARKIAPCVIFIDEVDALLQARSMSPHVRSGQLEVINEFMAEWDGISSNLNNGIIIMAATNRPFALDDAVLRRLPRRILIDLPDQEARVKILHLLLKDDVLHKNVNLGLIAEKTSGYSGSDLKNVGKAAAFISRRRNELEIRMDDLEKALDEVAPSISDEMQSIALLRKWDLQFGEGSNMNKRKKSKIGF